MLQCLANCTIKDCNIAIQEKGAYSIILLFCIVPFHSISVIRDIPSSATSQLESTILMKSSALTLYAQTCFCNQFTTPVGAKILTIIIKETWIQFVQIFISCSLFLQFLLPVWIATITLLLTLSTVYCNVAICVHHTHGQACYSIHLEPSIQHIFCKVYLSSWHVLYLR